MDIFVDSSAPMKNLCQACMISASFSILQSVTNELALNASAVGKENTFLAIVSRIFENLGTPPGAND